MLKKIGNKIVDFWNDGSTVEKLSVCLAISLTGNFLQALF